MATIFLSHTSIDKPFVEKLARDLEKLGINVWYDKYEIKVGESILWKIDEGIRESEYLGIVISKEALKSEWVKTEISSAWQKQVEQKGNFVLPIYYRDCEMPLFLQGIKYADFRTDYRNGLEDLVKVFGIKSIDLITEDNWRMFTRNSQSRWREFRDQEFSTLITQVCKIAKEYNFSVWVGGSKNPYSFVIYGSELKMGVRMDPSKGYRYVETDTKEWNPNNIPKTEFQLDIGGTVNEVKEYIYGRIESFTKQYGKPEEEISLFTEKRMNKVEVLEKILQFMKDLNWDKG